MIKILHLNTEKGWRGGENQMRLLIEGLQAFPDFENHVAALENEKCLNTFGTICKVFPIKSRISFNLWQAQKIANYCRQNQIQILDAQTARTHSLGCFIKLFMPELKLIVHRRVDNIPGKSYLTRKKYLSKKVDTFVAISSAIKNILENIGVKPEKIIVVKSAVPDLPYHNLIKSNEKEKWAKKLNIKANIPWLGNASAIAHQKAYDVLLKAINVLKSKKIPFHCLIAGNGPQENEIKTLCHNLNLQEYVSFVGFINEVPSFLSSLDILAVPSNNEGLGTIILEGIHAGCAIVATEIGGIPEMIQHQKTGLLIPCGSFIDLASSLENLIANPELRIELNQNAKRLAKVEFSVDAMVKGNIKVYQNLSKNL